MLYTVNIILVTLTILVHIIPGLESGILARERERERERVSEKEKERGVGWGTQTFKSIPAQSPPCVCRH